MPRSDNYSYIEVAPGLVVDSEGEVIDGPAEPADYLALIANRVVEWQDDEKTIELAIAGGKRALLKGQEGKRVAYGSAVATRMQTTMQVLDVEGLREEVVDVPFEAELWRDLALAATGFDVTRITYEQLGRLVRRHTHPKLSVEYVKVARATAAPPRVIPATRPTPVPDYPDGQSIEDRLAASLEFERQRRGES